MVHEPAEPRWNTLNCQLPAEAEQLWWELVKFAMRFKVTYETPGKQGQKEMYFHIDGTSHDLKSLLTSCQVLLWGSSAWSPPGDTLELNTFKDREDSAKFFILHSFRAKRQSCCCCCRGSWQEHPAWRSFGPVYFKTRHKIIFKKLH